jgi:hypothetical protein
VHGNVGQRSHHAKPEAFRRRVLSLVRRYYSGEPGERFGPTLAAEHLTEDHGLAVDAETLRRWMVAAGLWSRERKPDFKNVYQHEPTERQQRAGETPVSQFGRICARLGITLIGAGSPQSKGRVERNHGVHQDRLIKKMQLRKLSRYPGRDGCGWSPRQIIPGAGRCGPNNSRRKRKSTETTGGALWK